MTVDDQVDRGYLLTLQEFTPRDPGARYSARGNRAQVDIVQEEKNIVQEEMQSKKKYSLRGNIVQEEIQFKKKYSSRGNIVQEEIQFKKKYSSRRNTVQDKIQSRIN